MPPPTQQLYHAPPNHIHTQIPLTHHVSTKPQAWNACNVHMSLHPIFIAWKLPSLFSAYGPFSSIFLKHSFLSDNEASAPLLCGHIFHNAFTTLHAILPYTFYPPSQAALFPRQGYEQCHCPTSLWKLGRLSSHFPSLSLSQSQLQLRMVAWHSTAHETSAQSCQGISA